MGSTLTPCLLWVDPGTFTPRGNQRVLSPSSSSTTTFPFDVTIAEILLDEGYDVQCAANGLEALTILEDRALRPTLIILDLWMPKMDGLQFRSFRASGPRQRSLSWSSRRLVCFHTSSTVSA